VISLLDIVSWGVPRVGLDRIARQVYLITAAAASAAVVVVVVGPALYRQVRGTLVGY